MCVWVVGVSDRLGRHNKSSPGKLKKVQVEKVVQGAVERSCLGIIWSETVGLK